MELRSGRCRQALAADGAALPAASRCGGSTGAWGGAELRLMRPLAAPARPRTLASRRASAQSAPDPAPAAHANTAAGRAAWRARQTKTWPRAPPARAARRPPPPAPPPHPAATPPAGWAAPESARQTAPPTHWPATGPTAASQTSCQRAAQLKSWQESRSSGVLPQKQERIHGVKNGSSARSTKTSYYESRSK